MQWKQEEEKSYLISFSKLVSAFVITIYFAYSDAFFFIGSLFCFHISRQSIFQRTAVYCRFLYNLLRLIYRLGVVTLPKKIVLYSLGCGFSCVQRYPLWVFLCSPFFALFCLFFSFLRLNLSVYFFFVCLFVLFLLR